MNKLLTSSLIVVLITSAGAAHAERRGLIERAAVNANIHSTVNRQIERRPAEQSVTREIIRTNAQGDTATRSSLINRDSETGVATRTVSGVAFDGRSYTGEQVVSRTENGLARLTNVNDSEGNSRSGSANLLLDKENGTLTKQIDATRTNSKGETTNVSGESVLTRTENGLARETNLSDSNGNSHSGSSNLILDKENNTLTKQFNSTRTNSEGETSQISGESVLARTDDGYTRDSSLTDSDGNTRSRSVNASVNKEEGSLTKHITTSGPNGQASTTTTVKRQRMTDSTAQ